MPPNNTRGKKKDYSKYPFMNLSLTDMKGEKWKDIDSYDGYFKVSNFGRIWALPRPVHTADGKFYWLKEAIRKQYLNKYYNSYSKEYVEQFSVHIRYQGESATFLVNRLVYKAFVGPIDFKKDGLLVVHKDGDNCNNRYDNLMLMNGTQLYAHGLKMNKRPRSGKIIKKSNPLVWSDANAPRPIVQYTLAGKRIRNFGSVEKAAKAIGSSRQTLRLVINKKSQQLNGFVYRYEGDLYNGEYADFSWLKPVTQYNIEGKKLTIYPSVTAASVKTGIDPNTISKCALKKFKLAGGYVWRYKGEIYKGEYEGTIANKARTIIQYSLDGKKIARFPSANNAANITGFTLATLSDCLHRKTKVSHGFVWRYENEPYKGEYKYYHYGKPVTQFTLTGKRMGIFPSAQVATKVTGVSTFNIQKNACGDNMTAGGFVWKYSTLKEIRQLPPFEPKPTNHKPIKREVIQYSVEGKKLSEHLNPSQAVKATKVSLSTIYQSLDKKRIGGGFVWRSKGNLYRGEFARNPFANKAQLVTQYDLRGRKIRVFKSTREAKTLTNIFSISAAATGKLKTSGGFIWQYGDGPKKIDLVKHFASSKEFVRKISKPVIKYSLEGEPLAEYPSISAAARAESVRLNAIASAVKGKTKSAVGYYWKLKGRKRYA